MSEDIKLPQGLKAPICCRRRGRPQGGCGNIPRFPPNATTGAKARFIQASNAALKGRSSTVAPSLTFPQPVEAGAHSNPNISLVGC